MIMIRTTHTGKKNEFPITRNRASRFCNQRCDKEWPDRDRNRWNLLSQNDHVSCDRKSKKLDDEFHFCNLCRVRTSFTAFQLQETVKLVFWGCDKEWPDHTKQIDTVTYYSTTTVLYHSVQSVPF